MPLFSASQIHEFRQNAKSNRVNYFGITTNAQSQKTSNADYQPATDLNAGLFGGLSDVQRSGLLDVDTASNFAFTTQKNVVGQNQNFTFQNAGSAFGSLQTQTKQVRKKPTFIAVLFRI